MSTRDACFRRAPQSVLYPPAPVLRLPFTPPRRTLLLSALRTSYDKLYPPDIPSPITLFVSTYLSPRLTVLRSLRPASAAIILKVPNYLDLLLVNFSPNFILLLTNRPTRSPPLS